MACNTRKHVPYRVGEWLSTDQDVLEDWITKTIKEVEDTDLGENDEDGCHIPDLHPAVQDLKELIENDPKVHMFFCQMFAQVPTKPPYNQTPAGKPQIRSYRLMLRCINHTLTRAPEYSDAGLIGCPISDIIIWPMATPGGHAAFLHDKVIAHFKKILNAWGIFLQSPESCHVLNTEENGWFGPSAMKKMENFEKDFICDPDKPHYGFKSWDDFFTREFRPGARKVESPDDDSVIVNACESAPFKIERNVKRQNRFWIKSQPYSLIHMLSNDPLAAQFVGGTVYQAYLSSTSYHRWHSPVNGEIVKAYTVDGCHYSEAQSLQHGPEGFDNLGPCRSQGYVTAVATRAIIFIEADNSDIGLMCFMGVGMSEVSTCDITVHEGDHVKKGDQIGTFHYGGSTHCLIFHPGVEVEFHLHDNKKPGMDAVNIPINSKIATVIQ